jgi:hypothetical protein
VSLGIILADWDVKFPLFFPKTASESEPPTRLTPSSQPEQLKLSFLFVALRFLRMLIIEERIDARSEANSATRTGSTTLVRSWVELEIDYVQEPCRTHRA